MHPWWRKSRRAQKFRTRQSPQAAIRRASGFAAEVLERRVLMDGTVVFNEIMYHPLGAPTTEQSLEWVELHSQMAVDVDLSGWSIQGGIQYTFPEGTLIRGGGIPRHRGESLHASRQWLQRRSWAVFRASQ